MSYEKTPERIHKIKNVIRTYSSLIDRVLELDKNNESIISFLEAQKRRYELEIEEYTNLKRKPSILYSLYGKAYKDLSTEERRTYVSLLARKRREGLKNKKNVTLKGTDGKK